MGENADTADIADIQPEGPKEKPQVIVYSTPTCPYCTMAKEYLDSKGAKYEAVDVSIDSARQQEMIQKSGQMGVPVLDIGGTIIVGFDKAKIDAALSTLDTGPAESQTSTQFESTSQEAGAEA